MDDVSEARPLAKLQEQLEESTAEEDVKKESAAQAKAGNEAGKIAEKSESKPDMTSHEVQHSRKPLLNNVDNELDRLSRVSKQTQSRPEADDQILRQVHHNFYDAFDARDTPDLYPLPLGCDVEVSSCRSQNGEF
jgi:hypothetical protein